MNTIYKTYERFINAAKKFPRFVNVKRRPTTSTGGKLLQSICEELGAVEDAILDYKKDFFIVNYIGREDTIVDYLYFAKCGDIVETDKVALASLELKITKDKKEFYNDLDNLMYYQDGYFFVKNPIEFIEYKYDGFLYKIKTEKQHIWNVIDDFAWWCGLSRFENETNKELLQRTIDIFRERPSSSKEGLRNVIKNTLYNYGNIDSDEIIFEIPDEDNIYLLNDNNIELYEEISKFNRDIARTKQWDVDYWDNSFRSLQYLSHKWDAPVSYYKDGVGYNDSLDISSVKELDTELGTSITINGYKKSKEKIEEYIRSQNIKKTLKMNLKRYLDAMNPIPVKYKITASTLTEIEHPNQCFINTYQKIDKLQKYNIEELYISDNGVEQIERNKLENGNYILELSPDKTFTTDKCCLTFNKSEVKDFLQSTDTWNEDSQIHFKTNEFGQLINKNQRFFTDSVYGFSETSNLVNAKNGFKITNPLEEAIMKLEVNDPDMRNQKTELKIKYNAKSYSLMNNPSFVKCKNFVYDNNSKKYRIKSDIADNDPASLVIEFDGNYLEYTIARGEYSSVSIKTYIDYSDEPNTTHSYPTFNTLAESETKTISLNKYSHIRVEIYRAEEGSMPVIEQIAGKSYDIEVLANGERLSPTLKETYVLPKVKSNDIEIVINNYGKTDFNIEYVSVGTNGILELTNNNSTFELSFSVSGYSNSTGYPYLEIQHNGAIALQKQVNGKYEYVKDFSPYKAYKNNTSDSNNVKSIYLDLSNFESIEYANPEIKTANDGSKYINVSGGKIISEVEIYGSYKKPVEKIVLSEHLKLQKNDKVYANKMLEALVINGTKEVRLDYDKLFTKKANITEIAFGAADKNNLDVCFVIDYKEKDSNKNSFDIRSYAKTCSGNFKYLFIYDKESIEYIAYNTQSIVQKITNGFSLEKNFSPKIPQGKRVLYYINDVATNDENTFDVNFYDAAGTRKWTISDSTSIQIQANIDQTNTDLILSEELELTEEFNLSNNIQLNGEYIVNNNTIDGTTEVFNAVELEKEYASNAKKIELAKYIISVPDYVNVVYEEKTVSVKTNDEGSKLVIEPDGFNKLPHSNIIRIEEIKIGDNILNSSKYDIVKEPGFIVWKDANLYQKNFEITYTYKNPICLTFSNIDYLYELVNYEVDTLEKTYKKDENGKEIIYKITNLKDGEVINIDFSRFPEIPDKIIATCSNPVYSATVRQDFGKIIIQRIAEDNALVIKNGYYYIDGKEYYYFSNKYSENAKKIQGLEMVNVDKLAAALQLSKKSANYLSNARMERNVLNPTTVFNFKHNHSIPNISSANKVSACDTLFEWHTYKMKMSPNSEYDGNAIVFNNENNSGYAILDITKMLRTNKLLSIWTDGGNLKASLGREVLLFNQQLSKSLYVENIGDFTKYKDKAYYDCSNCDLDKYRYYLIISGYGVLIELLVSDLNKLNKITDFENQYNKAINKFNFNIEEKITEGSTINIDFSPSGMAFNNLEMAKDLTIQTGTSADWGITKLKNYDLSNDTNYNKFKFRNEYLTATANNAYIETKPFRLEFVKSINNLIYKVNDYHVNDLKGFKLELLTSNSEDDVFNVVSILKDANIITVSGNLLLNYIKLRITAEKDKVVTSIDLFAQYKEEENATLPIYNYAYGTCTTKIFDAGAVGNYKCNRITAIETEPSKITYYIRGAKFDDQDSTFTQWYNINEGHNFIEYRYFQFKIELKSDKAKTKIQKFEMKAVI